MDQRGGSSCVGAKKSDRVSGLHWQKVQWHDRDSQDGTGGQGCDDDAESSDSIAEGHSMDAERSVGPIVFKAAISGAPCSIFGVVCAWTLPEWRRD